MNETGKKIAYCGIEGAFAHIAAGRIFPDCELVPFSDFMDCYRSVCEGKCDFCVLPIENSYAGEVGSVTDIMFGGELFINGIFPLFVSQNLLGVPGSLISDIKSVISHPQALEQCKNYIAEHKFAKIEGANTALAAKHVAEKKDRTVAAIASLETAKLYGLEVLRENINESNFNFTRFAVLSKNEKLPSEEADAFVLMFTVKDEAGALVNAIKALGDEGFNMKVIRSRPLKNEKFRYYFYIEAEGETDSDRFLRMITAMEKHCETVKVMGSFSQDAKI
ncbi:MAG: bifunctional chorismate mutase/prephenate dehydratase [Lachnospiraceae bacterium]|nr:bifunctional chorismate mutase/prephenate dehydratase [Lachnospiraceae bacterium]